MKNKSRVRYVALGGCNTKGAINNIGNSYPERIAASKGWEVTNYGYTMSSTREGLQFMKLESVQNADILSIQYGGVDSWLTFKGSPFVLYYPNSGWRKYARKIVKKLKKYARKIHWHKLVGEINVVPIEEYISNIQAMIAQSNAKYVLLIDTYPNLDKTREPRILKYNQALKDLADGKRVIYIENYLELDKDISENFDDSTHLSNQGQQILTELILTKLNELKI
ncbi:SGNH/GDSL hydrolase family protein [Acinetobacter towneri]|uniref:SGNH/GDSL hydrolase family protein n=1 Tax=Acinetobacter towneri TaxID=202956 RepID=UPI002DB963B4|nr:SGNH/GDSL hydrolase family protein [Acinetobacter towneri]MEB6564831.1 SGNH/GDSL hydrolase family protein [Acinetobacter towneri]